MRRILFLLTAISLATCGPIRTSHTQPNSSEQKWISKSIEDVGRVMEEEGNAYVVYNNEHFPLSTSTNSSLERGYVVLTNALSTGRAILIDFLPPIIGDALPRPEPLGIKLGEPLPPGYPSNHNCKESRLGFICVKTPTDVRGVNVYAIRLSPSNRVAQVRIIFVFERDSYGTEVTKRYTELKTLLTKKWGPAQEFDYLKYGALWDKPREFARSLHQNERKVAAFWGNGNTDYPISMEMGARDSSTTNILLTYEHTPSIQSLINKSRETEAQSL